MDRFYVKPMRGLSYEVIAMWLNNQGDSAETLVQRSLVCEGRTITDVLELTNAQVDALDRSEYREMVYVFRQDSTGHVSMCRYFAAWR